MRPDLCALHVIGYRRKQRHDAPSLDCFYYVAHSLNRLGDLRQKQGKYKEAIGLFERSITTYDKALGPDSLESCMTRNNLANLYRDRRQFEPAEPLYQRSLAGLEKTVGPRNANVARVLDAYADMLKKAGRFSEAEPL